MCLWRPIHSPCSGHRFAFTNIYNFFRILLTFFSLFCDDYYVGDLLNIMCAAYEYVADSEEATLSQCESVRSLCSVDDADFRTKTQQFFEGMARLREEVEAERRVEQRTTKTHTVSRSFYPRRVSDNVTHRTNVVLNLSSPKPEPSGAELYATFSNKLLLPSLTQPSDRRRSASSASDQRTSHELGQFLRPDEMGRSLSVTSTPSTLQRPSSRLSESEESISMVDVNWTHRKPRRRQRPRPKFWEETEAETLSVVRTSRKEKKAAKDAGKQLREVERQKDESRRDEIAKQLEMVERQERKIKEELAKQQKMLQQFTAVRQREVERERVEDFVRQQELVKEQEAIRKREIERLDEIQRQHELAKQAAFQRRQAELEQAEKVRRHVETQEETSLIAIDVTSPATPVKSELQETAERSVTRVETARKPEMVGERPVEMERLSTVEALNVADKKRTESCDVVEFVEELPQDHLSSSPLQTKAVPSVETVMSPKCDDGTVFPASEAAVDDGATISVAHEVIHSEAATEILTPQDLQVVELVETSFEASTASAAAPRHSNSSEDDVFFDASDVDVSSRSGEAADADVMITGSLLMAPVFELPLTDVTAFDGAGAILECRVTGNPTPEVMWFVNGVEIRSMPPEVTVSYHAGVCRLVVVDVMPDDEGEYTVRAINEAGSCLTSAYLTVLRKCNLVFPNLL